jgi:2-polyprenyl-3-methyl-5-hydroxy-6-metoxy-1,4-benzoquinol methylase
MKKNNKQSLVTSFFDNYSSGFHNIYGNNKNSYFSSIFNLVTRKSMLTRFLEIEKIILENNIKTILDVGCGPGVHENILINKFSNKIKIVGIDISESMIQIAMLNNQKNSNVKFFIEDFNHFKIKTNYDLVFAVGVIEYIEKPLKFIEKMFVNSNKYTIFSVPKLFHPLTPQRKIRYMLRNCPLFFFTKQSIYRLIKKLKINNYKIIDLGRDYLVCLQK